MISLPSPQCLCQNHCPWTHRMSYFPSILHNTASEKLILQQKKYGNMLKSMKYTILIMYPYLPEVTELTE